MLFTSLLPPATDAVLQTRPLRSIIATSYLPAIPSGILWEVGYLVFFATFVAYFLIPYGQKRLRPTLVSMYTYLQPVIAAVISVWIGMDAITWRKVLAILLIVGGVVLVGRSRAAGK